VQDTPIAEVVDFLRSEYNIEIQLDLPALEDLGISTDDPISANLRNVSLGSALNLMLKQLDLTYVISDEVLLVTSEEEALTRLTLAVYPVGDLMHSHHDNHAGTARPATVRTAQFGGPRRTDRETSNSSNRDAAAKSRPADALVNAIVSCVASDTWVVNGGPEADLRIVEPGLMVVAQTQDVHEQISGLLRALRSAKQLKVPSPRAAGKAQESASEHHDTHKTEEENAEVGEDPFG